MSFLISGSNKLLLFNQILHEMRGTGRGKSRRGDVGRECSSFSECVSSNTTSQPQIQLIGIIETSLETEQSSNQSQGPL